MLIRLVGLKADNAHHLDLDRLVLSVDPVELARARDTAIMDNDAGLILGQEFRCRRHSFDGTNDPVHVRRRVMRSVQRTVAANIARPAIRIGATFASRFVLFELVVLQVQWHSGRFYYFVSFMSKDGTSNPKRPQA